MVLGWYQRGAFDRCPRVHIHVLFTWFNQQHKLLVGELVPCCSLTVCCADAEFVPGLDTLNCSVSMRDARQQTIRAAAATALPFLVSASICSTSETQCSKTTSLQPDSFFFIDSNQDSLATADYLVFVRYCVVGEPSVQVPAARILVVCLSARFRRWLIMICGWSTGRGQVALRATGDGVQELPSLRQQFYMQCLPCKVRSCCFAVDQPESLACEMAFGGCAQHG